MDTEIPLDHPPAGHGSCQSIRRDFRSRILAQGAYAPRSGILFIIVREPASRLGICRLESEQKLKLSLGFRLLSKPKKTFHQQLL
jgi:hypothetical protein